MLFVSCSMIPISAEILVCFDMSLIFLIKTSSLPLAGQCRGVGLMFRSPLPRLASCNFSIQIFFLKISSLPSDDPQHSHTCTDTALTGFYFRHVFFLPFFFFFGYFVSFLLLSWPALLIMFVYLHYMNEAESHHPLRQGFCDGAQPGPGDKFQDLTPFFFFS
jgi:hypothetical protein